MIPPVPAEGRVSVLEQHIGTILQITVVGLLGWSLMTTQSMSRDVEVLKVRVEAMNATIAQGTNDRYRGTDASRDFAAIRQEMQFFERRINALEAKVLKN
jgi:hypothetical protein